MAGDGDTVLSCDHSYYGPEQLHTCYQMGIPGVGGGDSGGSGCIQHRLMMEEDKEEIVGTYPVQLDKVAVAFHFHLEWDYLSYQNRIGMIQRWGNLVGCQ